MKERFELPKPANDNEPLPPEAKHRIDDLRDLLAMAHDIMGERTVLMEALPENQHIRATYLLDKLGLLMIDADAALENYERVRDNDAAVMPATEAISVATDLKIALTELLELYPQLSED